MIYDGIIHILDIDSQEHYKLPICEIFKKYIHLSTIDDNNVETIDLSGRNIKIADGTGWTQLLHLSRKMTQCTEYVIMSKNIDGALTLLPDAVIPVYDQHRSKQGFHGEVLYSYLRLPISECETNPYAVRFFNFNNREWESFEPISVYKVEESDKHEEIKSGMYGYHINTESGFFNCSNMHLCTSDTRNRDGKESWK